MWLLLKGVILTKDNLLKKTLEGGDYRCFFCDNNESIQHFFFDCRVAFEMAFGLQPPKVIVKLCGVWFNQVGQPIRSQICVGASAIF
jgi:hypothetical protein